MITERQYLESLLTRDTITFTKYFYKARFNRRYIVAKHHQMIADKLDAVLRGEITRLMINIFPRSGKTEIAVKNFIAQGFAINPSSKFIHLTYSNELALDNSEEIRDSFILSDYYQHIFPFVKINKASTAKNKWYTSAGGGLYATAAGGAITGFGAGEIDDITDEELRNFMPGKSEQHIFNGAVIIDDPLKPDDAFSDAARNRVNRRWLNTIKSRLNSINTPVIVIGQRLHVDDFCGHILSIEGDEWEVLNIPALNFDQNGEPSSIWESKMPVNELLRIKAQDNYTFESQYQQNPTSINGLLYPESEISFMELTDLSTIQPLFSFSTIDPADRGGDNYAAGFYDVIPWSDNSLRIVVKDVLFSKDGLQACCERVKDKFRKNHSEQAFIETNGIGMAAYILLKDSETTDVKPYTNKVEKMVRILSNYEIIKKYYIFDVNYKENSDYYSFARNLFSLVKEGTNKNDDSADVLSASAEVVKAKYGDLIYGTF